MRYAGSLFIACCLSATCLAFDLDDPGWHTLNFNVSNVERRAHVYVPFSGKAPEGWTLHVAIHGWDDDCDSFCTWTDLLSDPEAPRSRWPFSGGVQTNVEGEAERRQQLLACPCGLPGGFLGHTGWNAGVCCQRKSVNDLAYFSTLLNIVADTVESPAEFSKKHAVRSSRPVRIPVEPSLIAEKKKQQDENVRRLREVLASEQERLESDEEESTDLESQLAELNSDGVRGGPRRLPFNRVLGTGYSNGGFMVKALDCVWPDLFDATTAVSAVTVVRPGGTGGISKCDVLQGARREALARGEVAWRETKSVKGMPLTSSSSLEVHGNFDPMVPIFGDPFLRFPSVWNDHAAVLKRQQCNTAKEEQTLHVGTWTNQRYTHCLTNGRTEGGGAFLEKERRGRMKAEETQQRGEEKVLLPQVEFVRNAVGGHDWYITSDFNTTSYVFDFFDRVVPPMQRGSLSSLPSPPLSAPSASSRDGETGDRKEGQSSNLPVAAGERIENSPGSEGLKREVDAPHNSVTKGETDVNSEKELGWTDGRRGEGRVVREAEDATEFFQISSS
uniref:Feruloyl esterase n=1 Tax=Chromera velia CCMP2878 TaxID=1169474 RepID=A0A0G4HXP1_9ALVE|eukprot:Cvel_9302.t1-p1 / transcript=Cvel_9302.t1 / gene=Cvel_9302 / organism=Chromera_velia_CCMP2878 / gene_product=hypothetical protein / transcript_product=hypothetical protein / location=Cvel_scaffold533:8613-11723(+) / protein_length=557 / sequence_SO=supercontig / SO=protein_coding / is_pseudo=false